MKTKSPLLIAIGALALFVLVAFPSSSALATGHCADVDIYYEYAGPTGIRVGMDCASPSGAIIYFTLNGSDPTHDDSGNPGSNTSIFYGDISVPYHQWMHFRARAWKVGYLDSTNITYLDISNPVE
jgi:hypothetical protein